MKTVFSNRFFRSFVCFVSIIALVFALSPIKADALIIEGTVGSIVFVEALKVLSSALVAVGVLSVAQEVDWDNALYNLKSHMADLGFIDDNGNMTVYQSEAGPYYVDESVIEATRDYLFDSGAVSTVIGSPYFGVALTPGTFYNNKKTHEVSSYVNYFAAKRMGLSYYWGAFISDRPFTIDGIPATSVYDKYGVRPGYYYYWSDAGSGYSPVISSSYDFDDGKDFIDTMCGWFESDTVSSTLSLDVTAVAPRDKDLTTAYSTWVSVGIQMEDDGDEQDPIVVWPLGLQNSVEETKEKTQAEIQSGVSTYVPPQTDTETDTESGTTAGSAISQTWLGSMFQSVLDFLTNIKDGILEIPTKFATWFETIIEWIQGLKLKEWFESLIDAIVNLPTAIGEFILNGIREIFVPSEDFLTDKVSSIRSEFSFADSIISSGEYIGKSLQGMGSEPPVIYINLSNNRGPYNLGGEVAFLDLRWYEEYKPTVDLILSAFLWLLFAWRVYIKAPGIIRGLPGDYPAIRDMSHKE